MVEKRRRRRRLLLVEFVTHERWVFDSRAFPFVSGLARSLGDEVRWLCFGGALTIRKPEPGTARMTMRIPPRDVAVLARHLEEVRPTHVLLSHNVEPDALAVLLRGRRGASLFSTTDHPCPPGVTSLRSWIAASPARASTPRTDRERKLLRAGDRNWSMTRTDWLLRWLGLTPTTSPLFGRYLAGTISPHYEAVMANERARRFRPHILILGGTTCDHRRPVSSNPHYAGVDLSGCEQPFGCAFCSWYRGPMSDPSLDPVQVAEEQLRRVVETTGGRGRCCGTFDILDVRVFSRIDRFFGRVRKLGLPPSTFHFEPRVDRAFQVADRLDRALALAEAAGHSVYVYRMGAENLVDAENARFNKGLSLDQLDAGMARLAELARARPASFDYDRTLGYITCTPWTTLEMLSQTVERAIERNLDPRGIWLYTPLQLYRRSPITRLAEHDGLMADRFEDLSMMYEPAVNNVSFTSFLPWRFRDERVAVAFSLMVRFTAAALRDVYPDDVFAGDELYARVLAAAADPGLLARPDLFAREVIAGVREAAEPDAGEVLTAALERYRAVLPAVTPGLGTAGPDHPPPTDPHVERLLTALASVGARRGGPWHGIRVERANVVQDDAGMVEAQLRVDGRGYDVYVTDDAEARPSFFRTRHHKVTFGRKTPPRSEDDLDRLRRFVEALDAEASRKVRRRRRD